MVEEDRGISRRRIIVYGWITATAVIVGEMIGGTLAFLWPKVRGEKAERLLIAGRVEDFQVGKMAIFRKEKVFINRMDEGLLAMSAICTHFRCIVRWNGQKEIFECPCHGAEFNDVGEVLAGPPPRPLDIHPVKIAGGKVVVDTSNVIRRQKFDRTQLVYAAEAPASFPSRGSNRAAEGLDHLGPAAYLARLENRLYLERLVNF